MTNPSSPRRLLGALLVGLCLLSVPLACGDDDKADSDTTTTAKKSDDSGSDDSDAKTPSGDTPTREEFIAAIRSSQDEAFQTNIESMGIDPAKASDTYDEFIGCTYDAIADDGDLVARAMETDAAQDDELDAQLAQLAKDCQDTFNADMRALLSAVSTTVAP